MRNKNKESANEVRAEVAVREIAPLAKAVTDVAIKDAASLISATALLSRLNSQLDKITAEKERVTKPLNAALKAERSRWKPAEDLLNASISDIRAKMSEYATLAKQREDEAIRAIAERVGPGKGNLTVETALARIEKVEKAPEGASTKDGSITFRAVQRLKITSAPDIPDIYWTVNEDLVLETLKAGRPVPGAEIETLQVPVNRR